MYVAWPRIEDLAHEPELAALALLDAALLVAVQALIARNPEMLAGDDTPHKPARANAAQLIVLRYGELSEALDEYRELLGDLRAQVSEDEIPF